MQKTLRLVTLLAWGLWIPAYAQAPTFSLPAIPGAGGGSVPTPPAAPSNPSLAVPLSPAAPGLENLVQPEAEQVEAQPALPTEAEKQEALKAASPIGNPAPVANIAGSGAKKASPYNVAPPPLLLNNPAPDQNITAAPPPLPALALPAPPPALNLSATAIPASKPAAAKKPVPTWKTTLKPSYKPKETKFNYRRQVMPSVIYREQYSIANRHLPTARSMQGYDHAFLMAAARNDVNAVRAMLANGRRDVNLINAQGESVLIVAIRHGAIDTAKLLLARGADPAKAGPEGWNAFDYAQYLGDPVLLDAIYGQRHG